MCYVARGAEFVPHLTTTSDFVAEVLLKNSRPSFSLHMTQCTSVRLACAQRLNGVSCVFVYC